MATITYSLRRIYGVERFDAIMGMALALCAAAILLVVAAGDRAGVGVTLIDPATDSAASDALTLHSTQLLRLRFSESMDTTSVHLNFMPALNGTLTWAEDTLIFTPSLSFAPGQHYTVSLAAGAHAQNGRAVRSALTWPITIAPLSIVYLAPAIRDHTSVPTNLWRVDGAGATTQLTFAPYGVDDFAPSPDGTRIAFSQRDANGKTDLYLLTLASGDIRPITQCVGAPCRAPSWNPDGTRLVYERADSIRSDSDSRAWLLDLKTLQTVPLLAESRWLGKMPRWSPDGKTISIYDRNAGHIALVEVATGNLSFIQTLEDNSGQFAPRGQQIVYQDLVMTPQGAIRRLAVADFNLHTVHPLVESDGTLTDDPVASWSPDGVHLAVMRKYFDDRATPGSQVYEIDTTTGTSQSLVVDPDYAHGYLSWSPDGGQLLMQRFPLLEPKGQTSIWVLDMTTKKLTQVAKNGFYPQWVP